MSDLPDTNLQLRSTVTSAGKLELAFCLYHRVSQLLQLIHIGSIAEYDLDIQKTGLGIQADDFTFRLKRGVQLPADKSVVCGSHSVSYSALMLKPYVGRPDANLYQCKTTLRKCNTTAV